MKTTNKVEGIILNAKEVQALYEIVNTLCTVSRNLTYLATEGIFDLEVKEIFAECAPAYEQAQQLLKTLDALIPEKPTYTHNAMNLETGELLLGKTENELILKKVTDQVMLWQNCSYEKIYAVYK